MTSTPQFGNLVCVFSDGCLECINQIWRDNPLIGLEPSYIETTVGIAKRQSHKSVRPSVAVLNPLSHELTRNPADNTSLEHYAI